MAWISVHEQVIGGKLRNLAKAIGCSQNEALGILVRFWIWGINNADRDGEIIGAEKEDVAEVLTSGISRSLDPEEVVDAMVLTGWIDINESGLYIHDWEEWQKQWYRAHYTREKATERKRRERQRKKSAMQEQEIQPEEPEIMDKEADVPSVESKKDKSSGYSTDFESFWNAYPRKVEKGAAYKKYKTRLKDGWSPAELLEAARNYAFECERKRTEKEYIKHAKTFLSDSTPFADYIRSGSASLANTSAGSTAGVKDSFESWGE